jgi:glycerophosphoryl diester phosphodiesterase
VYLEIKASKRDGVSGRYPGIAEAVVREVLAAKMLDQVLFMSFDWTILPLVKELAHGGQTGALVSRRWCRLDSPADLTALATQVYALGCEWVNMDAALYTAAMPDFFHAQGLRLGLWTVNELTALQRFTLAGVDSLTTDRPDLFAALENPDALTAS